MKHSMKICASLLLALMLVCSFVPLSLADAGNFGGDSDFGFGDSGSDWGSSSDWSSDWDTSWSSSDDGMDIPTPFALVIVVAIVAISLLNRKKRMSRRKNAQTPGGSGYVPTPVSSSSLSALSQKDPNFNEQLFIENISNMYMQMQDAWEKKQWEPMRAFMTDALYQQMGRQLGELIQNGYTNHVERIAVLDAYIARYAVEGDYDTLTVRLTTRIVDYTVNDRTGALVSGDRMREKFMTYDWKLIRQKDQQTLAAGAMTSVNCPNCGAPMSVKQSGQCEYCGTVVTLSSHDWVLSSIKGVSQRTR